MGRGFVTKNSAGHLTGNIATTIDA